MNIKKYKVITLPQFKDEFYKIFGNVLANSKQNKIYYKLFNQIIQKLKLLEDMPRIYAKTEICDELGRRYRKIIIKQYFIIYTIDENNEQVYISHIFYKKSNYFNKL